MCSYWVIDGPVAKINTHLCGNSKEPGDKVITLQNTLLLELGREREREREYSNKKDTSFNPNTMHSPSHTEKYQTYEVNLP